MSKILVVQPYRMLQHAFAAALFPEHQVELTEKIPAADSIQGAAAAIVDAGALKEQGRLGSQELLAVKSWQIPTVWIDAGASCPTPARENLFALDETLTKESLHKALALCLKGGNVSPEAAFAPGSAGTAEGDSAADKEVIELVEVVEEESTREKS
jgi:hypothetical protein